ncbi:putative ATP-binding cassette sub-family C member 13 [Rhineura floridana]|uniref:putative ATP-binding cassette sub-family C member 13 n=1 Tax=Rhineura floridana TaxID=261503 RepID=UPI002AC7F93D|nr:putative ATP-binding cassette sub-family C member 13 [Rhineura floridana]
MLDESWASKGGSYERLQPFRRKKCSPEESANFFSKITYSWYSRVITLGYKKPLERNDLFELNESDSSYVVCPDFEKQWRKEIFKTSKDIKAPAYKDVTKKPISQKPSLLSPLWQTFKFLLIKVAILKVAAVVLAFTSPQIMKEMILQCEHYSDSYWNRYWYAVALLLVVVMQTLIQQAYQRFNMLTAVKIKTAVVGLVYKKALNLSSSSRQKYTTGEIVNLMSADIQQLMELAINLNLLWSAPFQILLAIAFLWQELGPSVLAGVLVLLLVVPINAFFAAKVEQLKLWI